MLLAIDSGNTNVVFSVYDGDEAMGLWRCSNNPRRTADEYMVWLMQLMELDGIDRDMILEVYGVPLSGEDDSTDSLEWRYLGWLQSGK